MKKLQNNKHKHVLFQLGTQGMAELSLAIVYGLVTSITGLFSLVVQGKRHQDDSTSRARALSRFGAFMFVAVLQHSVGSTSRARALSQLCAAVRPLLGSTSRARALSLEGVDTVFEGSTGSPLDSTSRARALSLEGVFRMVRRIDSTSRARALSLFGVIIFAAASSVVLLLPASEQAAAQTSSQLNFQGRLLTDTGSLVPDGTYNMEFNLYYVASGGVSQWTEDRLNTNTQGVTVQNGYFSVYLGEYDAFPALDWSQDLYLGMTIRGTGSCAWGACTPTDAEMTPRFKLTSVPYAFVSSNVASSNTNAATTNSDGVSITTGDALGATSDSGNITIDVGTATQNTGSILLGTNNASSVTIGNALSSISLQGPASFNGSVSVTGSNNLTVGAGTATFNGDTNIGNATTDTLTVEADAIFNGTLTVSTGDTFVNSGATLNTAVAIADVAGGGDIGTAGTTVDVATTFNINQTTASQALTLPTPTDTTAGRVVYINNVGSASFTMYGTTIASNGSNAFIWNGSAWITTVSLSGSSVSVVGTIDSQAKSSDGAVIAGNAIYLQTADATNPGLVSTGAQIFAGAKTFNGNVLAAANLGVNNASAPNRISVNTLTSADANAQVAIGTGGTGNKGLIVQAVAGQTANVFEVQDSTGGNLLSVTNTGNVVASGQIVSGAGIFRTGDTNVAATDTTAAIFRSGNSTTSGNTGAVTLQSGNATSGNSGNITIDSGTASGTTGTINIGTANASALVLGNTTTNPGFTFQGSGATNFNSGSVSIGVEDTTQGFLRLRGNGTGSSEGGEIALYTAADYDTTIESINIDVFQDDLRFLANGSVLAKLQGDTGNFGINSTNTANRLSVNDLTTADAAAQVAISTGAAGNVGLLVQGVASQTGDLLSLEASNGNQLVRVLAGGRFESLQDTASSFGGTGVNGQILTVRANQASNVALALRGESGQTGDLLQNQNDSGTALSGFNNSGNLFYTNSGFTQTIASAVLSTGDATITIPDTAGVNDTICLVGVGNCGDLGSDEIITVAASDTPAAQSAAADYVADGTSDEDEINSALTATAGGEVILLEGTFTIDGSISIPNNTALKGQGPGTVITIPNSHNADINFITNTDTSTGEGIVISDIKIDGNRANQSGSPIGMNGVYIEGVGATGNFGAEISRVFVQDMYSNSVVAGGIHVYDSERVTVSSSQTMGGTNGIVLRAASRISVNNNISVENTGFGIRLGTTSSSTVNGNVISSNSNTGLYLDNNVSRNTISGNIFYENASGGSGSGISTNASNVSNNTITGNTFTNSPNSAIEIQSDSNVISANNIYNPGGATVNDAIRLATADSNTIIGNIITDTSCTTDCYAINITDAASENNYLADNTYSSSGSDPATINDAGTGTIYANQQTPTQLLQNSSTLIQANASTALTGTVDVDAASPTVTGTGTAFLTELEVGDRVTIDDTAETYTVASIASDTSLTFSSNVTTNDDSSAATRLPLALKVTNSAGTTTGLIVQDNGNVGIGTDSPLDGYALTVGGSQYTIGNQFVGGGGNFYATTGSFVFGVSTSEGELIQRTGNDIELLAGGSVRLLVDGDNGNIGINNTTAPNRLSVNTLTTADASAQVAISTGGTTSVGLVVQGVASQTANLLELQDSAGVNVFEVAPSGDVTLDNNADATQRLVLDSGSTTTQQSRITFRDQGVDQFSVLKSATNNLVLYDDVNSVSRLSINNGGATYFQTGTAAADFFFRNSLGEDLVTILDDGNLQFEGATADGFETLLQVTDPTAARTITLPDASGTVLLDSTLGATAFLQGGNSFGATAVLGTNDANSLVFETDGTNRLFINTLGNVGIGEGSSGARLDILGAGAADTALRISDVSTDLTVKQARVVSRPYDNSEEDVALLFGNNSAAANQIYVGGGSVLYNAATELRFYTAANSTTTGGTERLIIDSSGNIGIGSAATGAANLLSVNTLTTADADAQVAVSTGGTGNVGLVIQGVASQTANLFELQTSTGTVGASIDDQFRLGLGIDASTVPSKLAVQTDAIGAYINATSTNDLIQLANSGTVVSGFNNSGNLFYTNSGFTQTIASAVLSTGDATITIPDTAGVDDTICLVGLGNCGDLGSDEIITVAASDTPAAQSAAADYVADGTSDEDEINSALTAAAGGEVILLPGTFEIDSPIDVPNNTTLRGVGAGTLIYYEGSGNHDIIQAIGTDRTGQTIRDLRIDGSGSTGGTQQGIDFTGVGSGSGTGARQGGYIINVEIINADNNAITIDGSDNNTLENIRITDAANRGIYLSNGSDNNALSNIIINTTNSDSVEFDDSDNNTLDNSVINAPTGGSSDGVRIDNGSTENKVIGNSISDVGNIGVNLDTTTSNVIASNSIANTTGDAIRVDNAASVNNVIEGNTIDTVGNIGINATNNVVELLITGNVITNTTSSAIDVGSNTLNTIITDNRIELAGSDGIFLDGSESVVNDNVVIDATGDGIEVDGINITVNDNVVENSGSDGIIIDNNSSEIVVSSNSVTASGARGILASTGTVEVVITGNFIEASTTDGVALNDAVNSVVSNNTIIDGLSIGIDVGGTTTNTSITGNIINNNASQGITVNSNSSSNTISQNTLYNNGGSGAVDHISISGDNNVLTDNYITDTAGSGDAINIGGVADGTILGGNVFSGTGATVLDDNGTNTVYLNQATGTNGSSTVFRAADSATAFSIQNAAGSSLFNVDTSNTELEVTASTVITGSASAAISGTAAVTNGSSAVTGTSTAFQSELYVGDSITINAETRRIVSITNDTSLTVDSDFTADASGQTITRLPVTLNVFTNGASSPSLTVDSNGGVRVQNTTDSTSGFIVLDSGGNTLFRADTQNGWLITDADLVVDDSGSNNGTVDNTLRFGGAVAGEAIGSKRTAGGNQFGLDFYTNSIARLQIDSAGASTFTGTLAVNTLGTADTSTYLCRNTSNILSGCLGTPLTNSLADNTLDAFDLQEGTNNYINISTVDSSENISFGNATTNPSFNFLGSGSLAVAGPTTVNNTLTVTGTLTDGAGPGVPLGLQTVNLTLGDDGDDDVVAGSLVNVTGIATGDDDDVLGYAALYSGTLSSGSSIAYASGAGWDVDFYVGDTTGVFELGDGGTWTFQDDGAGNNLFSITDVGSVADVNVTGNLAVDTDTLFVDSTNDRVGINTGSPSYVLDVAGTIPDASLSRLVNIGGTSTGTTDQQFGLYLNTSFNPSSNSDIDLAGIVSSPVNSTNLGTGTASLTGISGAPIYAGTGTITNLIGIVGATINNSTGTLNNSYAGQFLNPINASGSVTDSVGIWVENQTQGGTANINLLVSTNQNAPSGNYSIYNDSSYQNYFAGNLGIGTSSTTPAQALDVTGQVLQRSTTTTDTILINAESGAQIDFGVSGDAQYLTLGAFGGVNNLDTNTRDFSLFSTAQANILYADEATGNVTLGSNTASGKLFVDGTASEVQFRVQANSSQGVPILVVEDSGGGDYFVIDGTGSFILNGDVTNTVSDNVADAFDLQEGSNNYINVNTTNSSEEIQFGNTTTNPDFSFLGSGNFTANSNTAVFQNTTDSATAFQVQNAAGTSVLNVDTTNGRTTIGVVSPVGVGQIEDGGSLELDGARGIDIVGNYAYVASREDDGVQILDISDPTSPTGVGQITDSGSLELDGAIDIEVVGNYAYVASLYDDAVQILDISDPTSPTQVGQIADGGSLELDGAVDIVVVGNYAYVASTDDDGVQILDISDPTNPTGVGQITDAGSLELDGAHGITVVGNYAYVASRVDDGVQILDISDPTNPTQVGQITDGGSLELNGAFDIDVVGNYAYVSSFDDSGVQILDISDPTNPTQVGQITDGGSLELGGAHGITVVGNYAYVASFSDNGVQILDISDPTSPVGVGNIADGGSLELSGARDIEVVGNYAYVASGSDDGVQILDLGGFYTTTAEIGSLKVTTAQVNGTLTVNDTIYANNGINVQGNSLFQGDVSVAGQGAFGNSGSVGTTATSIFGDAIDGVLSVEENITTSLANTQQVGTASIVNINPSADVAGAFAAASISQLEVNASNTTDVTTASYVGSSSAVYGQGSGDLDALFGSSTSAINSSTGVVNSLTGQYIGALNFGGGNITNLTGLGFEISNVSANTVSDLIGIDLNVSQDAGGTTSVFKGIQVSNSINSGTVTDGAGVVIGEIQATDATNLLIGTTTIPNGADYSIYNASTRDNYFNGSLGIGDATPDGKLEVRQTAAADIFNLYDNTSNVLSVVDGGAATFQNATNSASAFRVQTSGGTTLLNVDTTNELVTVNGTVFNSATVQNFTGSANITQSNIDGFGTILISSDAAGYTATLTDPTNTTAGRLVYVTNTGSFDMTLAANSGGSLQEVTLKPNTSATMVWNGSDWTAAGASSSTDLQAAYNNTATSAGGAELILNAAGGAADGLTIRNNDVTPITGALLEVQASIGNNLFSVNNFGTEYVANGGAETSSGFSTDWTALSGTTVTRETVTADVATGQASVEVSAASDTDDGVANNLATSLALNTTYLVSFTGKLDSGDAFTTLEVWYTPDGGTTTIQCTNYSTQTLITSDWSKVTCDLATDGTTVTNSDLYIRQSDNPTVDRVFHIDNLSIRENESTSTPPNVQIGGGQLGGAVTLFTLDQSASPPVASGDSTYYGSMYYDTTTGRIQCYEADGWGACGSPPNNIITLTPEYAGAVLNGTGVGTMSADFCSDESGVLQVNDTLCDTGEAVNYYEWTSPQATSQTYSIYLTFQLPTTFDGFIDDNTITLDGRTTDTTDATVTYEVFRSTGSAITECGSDTTVTTSNNTWETRQHNGNEATGCSFAAGDRVIFKLNMTARNNDSVYVSDINFTYTND